MSSALDAAGGWDLDGVLAKIGHVEIAQKEAAVGVGIGAHSAGAFGGEFGKFGAELSGLVE